jgi:hypothetical protein
VSDSLLEAVRRLTALTESQVCAARTLQGRRLAELNTERVDALFALRVALHSRGLPKQDEELRAEVRKLALAERRLATLSRTVLERLARIDPSAPAPTYGRSGRLG